MPSSLFDRSTAVAALLCLSACGGVSVQSMGSAAAAGSEADATVQARSLTSTAANSELRGCLHCAP